MDNQITNPVQNGRIRNQDSWGSGAFGAPRGSRKHNGLDISATHGEKIYSPINGKVIRKSFPYATDLKYTGVVIEGQGVHLGISIKIFYMNPLPSIIGTHIQAGEYIGAAQNLTTKYPKITNHIHLEVKKNGSVLDPRTLIPGIIK